MPGSKYIRDLLCGNCFFRSSYEVSRAVLLNDPELSIECVNCGNSGNTVDLFYKKNPTTEEWVKDEEVTP